eukprot:7002065-Ditylum_brightwellii.AAC.1
MGVSQESYSHNEMYPLYESGQGAINLPNIWLIISSTLADIYDMEAHGATSISPDEKINTKLTLLGLVNDVTNQVNEFLNNDVTATELALNMEHNSTLWSTLLWLSGGLLELSKCSHHAQFFALLNKAERYVEKFQIILKLQQSLVILYELLSEVNR